MERPRMSRYMWSKIIEHCNDEPRCKDCIFYDAEKEECTFNSAAKVIEENYRKFGLAKNGRKGKYSNWRGMINEQLNKEK